MGPTTNADSLNLTKLAQPLGGVGGGGPNLEYDPEFLELEAETLGQPEVQYGDTLTEAIKPNWTRVLLLSQALLVRSRDLRLAMWLARAQLTLHGIAGLAVGLQLIHELLANCWEGLHPQLDPDDDDDPLLRINILAALCEPGGMLRDLLDTPLIIARSLGPLTLQQIDRAVNELNPDLSPAMLEGALAEADALELGATAEALAQAMVLSTQIEQLLTERVGLDRALDLSPLVNLLRRACDVTRQRLPDTSSATIADEHSRAPPHRGEINSRAEARQAIDRLCTYFRTHEPASPVPFLLQRASQLIDKNFMELLQDLAPDGLAQLALVSGIPNSDS
ncbi:type VI secretion system protein TssA [Pseudomonas syringae]|uniref:type VI secretion system protein TssA n=1 Tax=Pseudomonas syringae TaxID=317 RepID=UPI001F265AAE|nr:type VI secretion system protein TssA [Pseudomonas syringae]MCF5721747.1 type VI secretion system protein TssA [Pseudomonas syringae]